MSYDEKTYLDTLEAVKRFAKSHSGIYKGQGTVRLIREDELVDYIDRLIKEKVHEGLLR